MDCICTLGRRLVGFMHTHPKIDFENLDLPCFCCFQIAHGRRASVALPSAANATVGDGDSAVEKPLMQQSLYPTQPQPYPNQQQPPMMGAGGGLTTNDPNAAIIDQLNAEIAALRVEYTRGGGTRPDILRTIQSLEQDVAAMRMRKSSAATMGQQQQPPPPQFPMHPAYQQQQMQQPPAYQTPWGAPLPPQQPFPNPYQMMMPQQPPPMGMGMGMGIYGNAMNGAGGNPLMMQIQQQMSTMQVWKKLQDIILPRWFHCQI
jgi:hypothetical protein